MEQDRELLERAARTAGMKAWDAAMWTPLEDSGEALELAVKLRLAIVPYPKEVAVYSGDSESASALPCVEPYGNDPNAATRRAIVRCAASLAPV